METVMNFSMTDQKALSITQTFRRFGKKLFGFVRNKVQSNEDAEDILQDVWYQLSNFSNINEIENLGAWLYQVARNKVTDNYRKQKSDSLESYMQEGEEGEWNIKDILLMDESNSPDLAYFKEVFWKELLIALDELPESQKEVFVLNEIEDLTLQEIADKKGENLKTIISRKGYAVKYLRKRLNYLYQDLQL